MSRSRERALVHVPEPRCRRRPRAQRRSTAWPFDGRAGRRRGRRGRCQQRCRCWTCAVRTTQAAESHDRSPPRSTARVPSVDASARRRTQPPARHAGDDTARSMRSRRPRSSDRPPRSPASRPGVPRDLRPQPPAHARPPTVGCRRCRVSTVKRPRMRSSVLEPVQDHACRVVVPVAAGITRLRDAVERPVRPVAAHFARLSTNSRCSSTSTARGTRRPSSSASTSPQTRRRVAPSATIAAAHAATRS